jgi:RNA polymerase-binding transcription factor DksA
MLSKKKLDYFESLLTKLRKKILKEIDFEEETIGLQQREASGDVSSYTYHMADQGTDAENREVAAFLATSEGSTLADIDDALRKIYGKKEYGICEACDKPIAEKRLKAVPHAKLCRECQSMRERG